jgi:hypothetical protein
MNKQEKYVAPGVEIHLVVLEQFIAAAISYKMSISGSVQYEDYTAGTDYDATQDVIISFY